MPSRHTGWRKSSVFCVLFRQTGDEHRDHLGKHDIICRKDRRHRRKEQPELSRDDRWEQTEDVGGEEKDQNRDRHAEQKLEQPLERRAVQPLDAVFDQRIRTEKDRIQHRAPLVRREQQGEHRDGNPAHHAGLPAASDEHHGADHTGERRASQTSDRQHRRRQQKHQRQRREDTAHRKRPIPVFPIHCHLTAASHTVTQAVETQQLRTAVHRIVALRRTVAAVLGTLAEHLLRALVFVVVRLHAAGLVDLLHRLIKPSLAVADIRAEIVPFRVAVGHAVEQSLRHADVADVDRVAHLIVDIGVGAAISGRLTGVAVAAALVAAAALIPARTRRAAGFALLHDRVIRLVDLLHLLLRQIRQRVVDVVVRMILARQLAVGALYFIIRRIRGDIENFIWIQACFFLRFDQMYRSKPAA